MLTLTAHVTDACPCDPAAQVLYVLEGDETQRVDTAGSLQWALRGQPGRLKAFAVLEASDDADSGGR